MKNIVLSFLFVCAAVFSAYGQSRRSEPVVVPEVKQPDVTLKITLVVDKESVRVGPYARFAQKYMGALAPLSNKDTYSIVDASISPVGEEQPWSRFTAGMPPEGVQIEALSNTRSDTSFVRVNVDRNSTVERSAEAMAQQAAETIFALRKQRQELITGDAGENVFGDGMKAALEEIDRLENEYISLFMGKQFRQRTVKAYYITPEQGKNNVVIARFSENGGLIPASDLSARPIALEMSIEGPAQSENAPARGKNTPVNYVAVDMVNCRVTDGKTELAARRLSIPQMSTLFEVR